MFGNSTHTYGAITKTFHWLTALLIITMVPLGIIASRLPYETSEQLSRKAWLFSLHKTLGVTILIVAVLRILWAVSQPKPGALNANKPLEHWLAETVHWLLYASLIIVPLSGWLQHSATTGFAPIWPPISTVFGQYLPFIPKSESLAHIFAGLHITFERVLVISILLHFIGAMKHHFIDKDITLKRMLAGHTAPDIMPQQHKSRAPLFTAAGVYVVALVTAMSLGVFTHEDGQSAVPKLEEVASDWTVRDGTIQITIRQMGSDVTGSFEDWTAAISFEETADRNGLHGDVNVRIAIGSLTLGSVTGQALGADFFAVDAFPTATFTAPITSTADGFVAEGTLSIKGADIPVRLPFELSIADNTATMQGQTTLNRTDFNIGESYPDETSLGFDVIVTVDLTAQR